MPSHLAAVRGFGSLIRDVIRQLVSDCLLLYILSQGCVEEGIFVRAHCGVGRALTLDALD